MISIQCFQLYFPKKIPSNNNFFDIEKYLIDSKKASWTTYSYIFPNLFSLAIITNMQILRKFYRAKLVETKLSTLKQEVKKCVSRKDLLPWQQLFLGKFLKESDQRCIVLYWKIYYIWQVQITRLYIK